MFGRDNNGHFTPGGAIGIVCDLNDPLKQGRIRVWFPWLDTDAVSFWARIRAAQAGHSRGNFIRPEIGDEVLLMFERGDFNQPFVVGTLWNGADAIPGPGNPDGLNDHKWFQSRCGHQLIFNDNVDGGWIEVHDGEQRLHTRIDVPKAWMTWRADTGFIHIRAPKGNIRIECEDLNVHTSERTDIQVANTHQITVGGSRTVTIQQRDFDQQAVNTLKISTPVANVTANKFISTTGETAVSVGEIDATIKPRLDMVFKGKVKRTFVDAEYTVGQFRFTLDGQPSGPLLWRGAKQKIQSRGSVTWRAGATMTLTGGNLNASGSAVSFGKDTARGQGLATASLVAFDGGVVVMGGPSGGGGGGGGAGGGSAGGGGRAGGGGSAGGGGGGGGGTTMAVAKMNDLIVGNCYHHSGPAPSIPAGPIPFHPYSFSNPICQDCVETLTINDMPAAPAGATALGTHTPPIPMPPWLPLPFNYRSNLIANFQSTFLEPLKAGVEATKQMALAIQQGESMKSTVVVEGEDAPGAERWSLRTPPLFGMPGEFVSRLQGVGCFPNAVGVVAIAAAGVQVDDRPLGLTELLFAHACSDVAPSPNAKIDGVSNVHGWVNLNATLEQGGWSAAYSAKNYSPGGALGHRDQRVVNNVGPGTDIELGNETNALQPFKGFLEATAKGHPVDVVSGTLFDQIIDHAWHGEFGVDIERFHNSRGCGVGHGGMLGIGWRLNLEAYLSRHTREGGSFWVLHTGDMRAIELPVIDALGGWAQLPAERLEFCRSAEQQWDVTDRDGRVWRYVERQPGLARLEAVLARTGLLVAIDYDREDRLAAVHDRFGERVIFEYAPGRIELWRARADDRWKPERRVVWHLDAQDKIERVEDLEGNATTFEYDGRGRLLREILPTGYRWHFHYDTVDRVVCTYGDDLRYYFGFDYQPGASVTRVVDGLGHVSTFRFDAEWRTVAEIDPLEAVTVIERDDNGFVTDRKGPQERDSGWVWDANGRLAERRGLAGSLRVKRDWRGWIALEEDAVGAHRALTYDARGRVVRERLPDGTDGLYRYDALDRITSALRPDGSSWRYVREDNRLVEAAEDERRLRYTYDGADRLAGISVSTGLELRLERDRSGRITKRQIGESTEAWTWRPEDGELVEYTAPGDRIWRRRLDGLSRPIGFVSPGGLALDSTRGLDDRYATHTLKDGFTYRYLRDPAGRLAEHGTSDGRRTRYAYDTGGALSKVSNTDGKALELQADHLGLTVAIGLGPDGALRFERDRVGRVVLAERSDRDGTTSVSLRRAPTGAVIEEDGPAGAVRSRYNRGRLRFFQAGEASVGIERDPRGRPVSVAAPDGEHQLLSHALGDHQICPGGLSIVRFGDEWGVYGADGRALAEYTVTRDADGRCTADTLDVSEASGPFVRSFAYDVDGALDPECAGLAADLRFESHQLRADGHGEITSDACGRVTERWLDAGRMQLWWDRLGQLTEVELPDGRVVRYRYDAFGRMVERIFEAPDGARWSTRYSWSGDRLACAIGPDAAQAYLSLEADSASPWAIWDGGALHMLLKDVRGAVVLAVRSDGTISWTGRSQPFGATVATGSLAQPFRLAGMWADPDTGLYYNRFRWYAPDWGRYLSPDPLGISGGLRPYEYAAGDPIHRADPLGLACADPEAPVAGGGDASPLAGAGAAAAPGATTLAGPPALNVGRRLPGLPGAPTEVPLVPGTAPPAALPWPLSAVELPPAVAQTLQTLQQAARIARPVLATLRATGLLPRGMSGMPLTDKAGMLAWAAGEAWEQFDLPQATLFKAASGLAAVALKDKVESMIPLGRWK